MFRKIAYKWRTFRVERVYKKIRSLGLVFPMSKQKRKYLGRIEDTKQMMRDFFKSRARKFPHVSGILKDLGFRKDFADAKKGKVVKIGVHEPESKPFKGIIKLSHFLRKRTR